MTGFWNVSLEILENNRSANINGSLRDDDLAKEDLTIWDIPSIRITFIVIYSIVFLLCFLGNFTVILVVTLHWKMRSITNFCLGNLAVADLCVAIFCIFQNLYSHMSDTWVLGKSICKIYHFINEMSLTASVLILVVISIERYLAIKFPMQCKSWLTVTRLRLTIGAVWGISGIYSLPRLYYTTVISHNMVDGTEELICTPNRKLYNSNLFDAIHMGLLFCFPLLVISVLYTIIGIALWKSSKSQQLPVAASESSSSSVVGGDDRNGVLVRNKRHRARSACREILCCSFKCLRRSSSAKGGYICSRRSSLSSRASGRIREVRNGIKPKVPANEASCQFSSSRNQYYGSENLTYTVNSRESSPEGTRTKEPVVVIKFDKVGMHDRRAKKKSTTKRCKILMKVAHPRASKNVDDDEIRSESTEARCNQREKSLMPQPHSISSLELTEIKEDFNQSSSISLHISSKKSSETKFETKEVQILNPVTEQGGTSESVSPASTSRHSVPLRLRRMKVLRATNYGTKALEARRKIIKMLIVIVLTFTLCNLPFHGRKIWQNWSSSFDGTSTFSVVLTQVTTIIRYANSAINPLLYAFMSAKFRQCLADFIGCRLRRNFRTTRNFSIRSTNVIPISMTA